MAAHALVPESSVQRTSKAWSAIPILLLAILCTSCSLALAQTGQPVEEITSALRSKEYGKAIQLLQGPLKNSPHDPRLLTLQGMALAGQQRNQDALAAALYLARDVLYVQLADFDRAEADFEKANDLDPHLDLTGSCSGNDRPAKK